MLHRTIKYSLVLSSVFVLISCQIAPTPMPHGYHYHDNEFNAAPGPEVDQHIVLDAEYKIEHDHND